MRVDVSNNKVDVILVCAISVFSILKNCINCHCRKGLSIWKVLASCFYFIGIHFLKEMSMDNWSPCDEFSNVIIVMELAVDLWDVWCLSHTNLTVFIWLAIHKTDVQIWTWTHSRCRIWLDVKRSKRFPPDEQSLVLNLDICHNWPGWLSTQLYSLRAKHGFMCCSDSLFNSKPWWLHPSLLCCMCHQNSPSSVWVVVSRCCNVSSSHIAVPLQSK